MSNAANLASARKAADKARKARLEDVLWMAATGENLSGAAARLGINTEALRAWCRRWAPETGLLLSSREPGDPNQRPGLPAMQSRRAS